MHLCDRLTIDGTRRTRDGYLAVNARVARAGNVQTYLGSEVGRPDVATVRVFRPESEVFDKDTLASFAHRPVTLGHPSSQVTADTWRSVAKGWSDGEVARDGEFVRISMLLADADAIRAVELGTRQISLGYDCELIWGDGITPTGEAYDAKQVRIRGNHVALVEAARGGPELRIGDSMSTPMIDARTGMIDEALIDQEARKPAYDGYRGLFDDGGQPMERQMAIRELISASTAGQASAAAHNQMIADTISGDVHSERNDRQTPQFSSDGRPLATLADTERAREEMIAQMQSAHRR